MLQGMDACCVKMCPDNQSCPVRLRVGVAELSALFRDRDKNLTEDTEKKQPRWQADTKPRGSDVAEGKGGCVRCC